MAKRKKFQPKFSTKLKRFGKTAGTVVLVIAGIKGAAKVVPSNPVTDFLK